MTGWWKAITKNTHNADWVSDLVEVENSIGSEDTADVTADDLLGKKIFSKFYQKTNSFVPISLFIIVHYTALIVRTLGLDILFDKKYT